MWSRTSLNLVFLLLSMSRAFLRSARLSVISSGTYSGSGLAYSGFGAYTLKRCHRLFSTDIIEDMNPPIVNPMNGDELITGLNGIQDISVKVVNCRELVQEAIIRNDLSPLAAEAVAETTICSLMMGSNLKGLETLQIALVGNGGVRNVMAITNGKLEVRCRAGESRFFLPGLGDRSGLTGVQSLLGFEGQVQVTRSHPAWKQPQCGIVQMDMELSIPVNLALYMQQSEQRKAVMLTDVVIEGNLCRTALGLMVETLPGAKEKNVEKVISNLERIKTMGLRSYLVRDAEQTRLREHAMTAEAREALHAEEGGFRNFFAPLSSMVSDCLKDVEFNDSGELGELDQGIAWSKFPVFKCSCGIDRVWRTLAMLPPEDIGDIIKEGKPVEVKCDFCGEKYVVSCAQLADKYDTSLIEGS